MSGTPAASEAPSAAEHGSTGDGRDDADRTGADQGAPGSSDTRPDDTVTYSDPGGRFTLRHAVLWQQREAPGSEGDVTWLLRLERGQPDRPIPPGARRPPNGVRLDVGLARLPSDVLLLDWVARSFRVDDQAYSVTADGLALRVGPDALPAWGREGQILPYFGRWREWLIEMGVPGHEVFVLRARSYGADELRGMFHAKVVVATFRPYVPDTPAPAP